MAVPGLAPPPAPQLMVQGVPFLGASLIRTWEPERNEGRWVHVAVRQRSGSWTSGPQEGKGWVSVCVRNGLSDVHPSMRGGMEQEGGWRRPLPWEEG